jgi:hypothetical protein
MPGAPLVCRILRDAVLRTAPQDEAKDNRKNNKPGAIMVMVVGWVERFARPNAALGLVRTRPNLRSSYVIGPSVRSMTAAMS